MKNKCGCYHIQKKRKYIYHPLKGRHIGYDVEVGVCNGTKEVDECSCDGDRTKCDFYSEVREKAKNEFNSDNAVTNADNIRSMTDEKLAEHLVDIGWDCHLCSEHERLENEPLLRNERCDEQCAKHCLEWLKKNSK